MAENQHDQNWWSTIPGILTGATGVIAAVSGLIVALHQIGVFEKPPDLKPSVQSLAVIQKKSVDSEPGHSLFFEVHSELGWQNTRLYVQKGEVVKLEYNSGQWKGSSNGALRDPSKIIPSNRSTAHCYPVPENEAGAGALIAKIGDEGKPVDAFKNSLVGEGYLYLRINDCDEWLSDNTGIVNVGINVIQ